MRVWLVGRTVLVLLLAGACSTRARIGEPVEPRDGAAMSVKVAGACSDVDVRGEVRAAEDDVARFARDNGWDDALARRTFDAVEIFDTQAPLWRRVLELNELPATTAIPTAGLVAGIEGRVLVAVCPREYERLNPEYARQPHAWRHLLAHEMAHRFHVNVLGGHDDAMGPAWFFEGFAVVASGQNLDEGLTYSSAREALAAAHDKAPLAYRRYAAAVRFFIGTHTLRALVTHAASPDFETWLRVARP